jgi:hypothetical protein
MGTRVTYAPGYKTYIKKTTVRALQAAFQSDYYDEQFKNLRVTLEYPLDRANWPAILVSYREAWVRNAGLAHQEYLYDTNGELRAFQHSMFKGALSFEVLALSPLDRDILSDSIVELIRFGTLETVTNDFFTEVYDDSTIFGSQLTMNSDELTPLNDSVSPTPWDAEDSKIYETGYSIDVFGSYYSADRVNEAVGYLERINVYPYIYGEEAPDPAPLSIPWLYTNVYSDDGRIISRSEISAS